MAVTTGDVSGPTNPSVGNQTTYLVQLQGQQFGPYTLEVLRRYVAEQRVSLSDFAWAQGMPSWVRVSQIIGSVSVPMPPRPPPQQRIAGGNPHYRQPQTIIVVKPQSYMLSAILVTLFCCLPFGIVSIVYAAQVDSKFSGGDYAGAQQASNSARNWYHAALVCGLVIIVISIAASQ
jgi:hypothetical protein